MNPLRKILALALAGVLVVGCQKKPEIKVSPVGHFAESAPVIDAVQRVVFIPLASGPGDAEVAADLTGEIFQALQGRHVFRLELLGRDDPRFQLLPTLPTGSCSLKDLAAIRRVLKCNAVLMGRLSNFQPYPRMQATLDLQLMDLKDGQLLWGVDNTWDATDRSVQHRMEEYFEHKVAKDYQPANWEMATLSPHAFERFVAYEAVGTLPTDRPQPKERSPAAEAVAEKMKSLGKELSSD